MVGCVIMNGGCIPLIGRICEPCPPGRILVQIQTPIAISVLGRIGGEGSTPSEQLVERGVINYSGINLAGVGLELGAVAARGLVIAAVRSRNGFKCRAIGT